jgi:hypothetical protein
LLRGVDPLARLRTGDQVAADLLDRALERAQELRQQELDHLARQTANFVLAGLGGS